MRTLVEESYFSLKMTWLEPYFAEILFHRISECALDCYLQHFYGHHFARSVDRRSNVAGQRLASNLPLSLSRKMKTQRAAMMKCPFR